MEAVMIAIRSKESVSHDEAPVLELDIIGYGGALDPPLGHCSFHKLHCDGIRSDPGSELRSQLSVGSASRFSALGICLPHLDAGSFSSQTENQ
jgi:hypothetical protein